jgi:transcriptional regulator with XRE-family HTH domain
MQHLYDNRIGRASPKTISVADGNSSLVYNPRMLGTEQLLRALENRGISQAEMARVLGLPSSRISEMYAGRRQVKLDEAKRLVEAFDLDDTEPVPPISEQTARLLILHVANQLRVPTPLPDDVLRELALDFQAFSRFARAHLPAPSLEATTGFLAGRRSDREPRGAK